MTKGYIGTTNISPIERNVFKIGKTYEYSDSWPLNYFNSLEDLLGGDYDLFEKLDIKDPSLKIYEVEILGKTSICRYFGCKETNKLKVTRLVPVDEYQELLIEDVIEDYITFPSHHMNVAILHKTSSVVITLKDGSITELEYVDDFYEVEYYEDYKSVKVTYENGNTMEYIYEGDSYLIVNSEVDGSKFLARRMSKDGVRLKRSYSLPNIDNWENLSEKIESWVEIT